MQLPSSYQSKKSIDYHNRKDTKIHYVYTHTDPNTETVVYVGKGSRGRAWHCAETNSRSPEHALWLNGLIKLGYTPDSWVTIIETGLTEKESLALEATIMQSYAVWPMYNKKPGEGLTILSKEEYTKMKELRDQGLSYENIALLIPTSTMTVYRALNGKTKGYNKYE